MKEEKIVHQLRDVQLPDIKTISYERRLRMTLLEYGYLKVQKADTPQKEKITFKGVICTMKETVSKGLQSRQPVWLTATVSMLIMGLVLTLSLTLPFNSKSVYAETEKLAQEAVEVKEALGGGEIQIVRIDIGEETGKVLAKGRQGSVLAEVDLDTKQITGVTKLVVDEQAAIKIAKEDSRVKELLDSGAVIGEVSTMNIGGVMGNVATGETEVFSEALVMVEILHGNKTYVAQVGFPEAKLVQFYETIPMDSVEPPPGISESFSVPDPEFEQVDNEE
ncbi:MAG: hypothetical protein JW712_01160 [Dehalococcoidales bacterium]|nr:hypothetical protein [Dehalococcoidales bacterium]